MSRDAISRNLIGMELGDIEARLGPDHPKFRARQVYEALYRRQTFDLSGVSNFSKPLRAQLIQHFSVDLPGIAKTFHSADGTRRYLLSLADGKSLESVWMPEGQRSTICISSQIGCPVDCKFCLTALLGLERSLTASEIVGQVLRVVQDNQLSTRDDRVNIVMMGQGEPLLNLPNVLKACRLLTDPLGIGLSPKRITVSTSGIIPKIEELAKAEGHPESRPRLAISLNASSEEQRRELMPITRKYHLKELLEVCRAYPLRPWEKIFFEYVMLKGVNDTDADARRVVKLLANLNAKVNLIALNPGPGISFETPDPERVASFHAIIRKSLPVFVRKPRGLDVYAACGQLKRMELNQIA